MRITEVNITKKQRVELEYVIYFDSRSFMRKRIWIILYKSDGMSSEAIAKYLSCLEQKVNRWMNRYIEKGIEGLGNKHGQWCKPIVDSSDEQAVIEAIEKNRLSVKKANARWQQATGKEAGRDSSWLFISFGAKFGRIRRTTKGTPSP